MNLYDLINIKNQDIEGVIDETLSEVKNQLAGLGYVQTCKIYSSYIAKKLREKHVVFKLIDTQKDLQLPYSHFFIEVPKDSTDRYIIDLTFNQFGYNERFALMYQNGYQILNDDLYEKYIKIIANAKTSSFNLQR